MSWAEATEKIVTALGLVFVVCTFITGKWPWDRRGN